MNITGWLFDLYPLNDRIVLWFISAEGKRLRVEDEFHYVVYLGGPEARLRGLAQAWKNGGRARRVHFTLGRDLWSGAEIPVLALELKSYAHLPRVRGWLGAQKEGLAGYNCDLDLAAYYCYRRRLWPCAWYDLTIKDGRLVSISPLEEQFALEFSLPPLSIMTLGLTRDHLIPLDRGNGIVVGWEGQRLELEARDAAGLVRELGRLLKRQDPDLVLSDWGDEEIIPPLWNWSQQYRVPLPLDRELGPVPRRFKNGRSYFSYGQIIYQGASSPFFGRWHLDRRNSFFFREAGLAGLAQITRLGQIPLQQAARTSPGTLITSMQLARAVGEGILIPWRKGEPERFKSAEELLVIDKGGLTFMPSVGVHFQTAELDFASMYPTIMAIHNISPETVNCGCCSGDRVPEAGYRLCRRREGLVPRTLRPILVLRENLKARAREVGPDRAKPYKERQNALKWMLVTCFGYLGYKNARFGRIKAHEAVIAHGRDKLLTAKEICEDAGYRVLHGLTDCLWIKKPGGNREELEALCREISAATGVKLSIDRRDIPLDRFPGLPPGPAAARGHPLFRSL